jgi:hypothetical protein
VQFPHCLKGVARLWCADEVLHGCTALRSARPFGAGRPSVGERQLCLGVANPGLSLCSPLGTFQLLGPCRARLWAFSNSFMDAKFRARLLALPAFAVLPARPVRDVGKCGGCGSEHAHSRSSSPPSLADPVQPAAPLHSRPATHSTSTTDRLVTLSVRLYHD